MADIFISYTKKDRSRVEPLAKALEDQGWTVWWDPIIPTGKDFDDIIEEELSKARCVIVIWTKKSVKSKYVKGEAREALNQEILIPIEIESGIKPPYDFRSLQTLSLTDWDGSDNFPAYQKLVSDISRIISEDDERREGKAKIKPDKTEPVKINLPEPIPDIKAPTEPKSPELRKTSNVLKFGVLAGTAVMLIAGIWWWVSSQQANEVRQELEKLKRQALNLENAVSNLDKLEQIEELTKQKDTLDSRVAALSERATKAGFRSQLAEFQKRLKQTQTKLANKKKELIAARKGKIFVESIPEKATVKILNIDEPFQQGMELEPEKYHVEVSSEGYEPQDGWIELSPGEEKRTKFELKLIKVAQPTPTQKDRTEICIKEGKQYGITEGPFQGRWYHYYERGLSFAEGHCWGKAEIDLRKALKQRDEGDRIREKTYGIYFIDYFPHRELGIVLFYQKRYIEAIRELETSLNATVTAKAEHYRDQILILSQTQDKRPPEILSRTPDQGLQTNNSGIRVSGIVRDDNFVKSVRINNKPIRIVLMAPEVQYDTEVSLRNGNNTITISAADIAGNSSSLQRSVTVDRLGPVISVDEPAEGTPISSREVRLKGYVADDTNLASVLVNGREILNQHSPEFILDHSVPLTPQTDRITIIATDLLGNQTKAEIPLSSSRISGRASSLLAGLQMIQYADAKDPGMARVRQDRIPPVIELKDWTEEQSVYLEEIYIEGSAYDNDGVTALVVNDISLLRRSGKRVYFNTIVQLKEGNNTFHFKAMDNSGNLATKSINIHRNIQEIRKLGSRMDLVMLPFERKGEPGEVGRLLEDTILKALIENGRFNMKRRLAPESGNLDDPQAVARIGKKMDANYVLVGSVEEQAGALEIWAQIIETKTLRIVTIQNVYGVDIDRERLNKLCRGLVIKLEDALPISEGTVVRVTGKKVYLDLGKESRIKEGMRCIIFKEGEPLVHPITGKAIGSPMVELGRARILAAHEGYSEAEIQQVLADGIAPSNKFIMQ